MVIHVHREGEGAQEHCYVAIVCQNPSHPARITGKQHRNPVWIFPKLGHSGKRGRHGHRAMNKSSVKERCSPGARPTQNSQKRFSISHLRHSYATICWRPASISRIQKYLGHRSLATTMNLLHLTTQAMSAPTASFNDLMQTGRHEIPSRKSSAAMPRST